MNKPHQSAKSRIVTAAWHLFYEQGYDRTTIDEIVELSETSKGSFYHYFSGKDDLLGSLAILFDDTYDSLIETVPSTMNAFDKLMFYNRELFRVIENTVSVEMLARMYGSQLTTKGERQLLDHTRSYYKILRKTVDEGMKNGELSAATPNEIVKVYALCERGLLYDWCVCNGEYSLTEYSERTLPKLMAAYRS